MKINEEMDKTFEKYKYSEDLREALKRCIHAMIEGKSEEEIELLIKALNNVEIFVFDQEPTKEQKEQLNKAKLKGRNAHVKDITNPEGKNDYEKKEKTPGAYCSDVIFDEKMKPIDHIEYIYITRLSEYSRLSKTYNTTINLGHLIHELGHAWASQNQHFVELENGNIQINHGLKSMIYKIDKANHTIEMIETNGTFLEEAINTVEEERVINSILEVDHVDEIEGYIGSEYQACGMAAIGRVYVRVLGERVKRARMFKEYGDLEEVQEAYRKTQIFSKLNSYEYLEEKKRSFYRDLPNKAIKFFEEHTELYFSACKKNDFLGNIDHVMEQLYSLYVGFPMMLSIWSHNKEQADEIKNRLAIFEAIEPLKQTVETFKALKAKRETKDKERTASNNGKDEEKEK